MKKVLACLLAALFLLGTGCSRDMNWVISNEPSVWGVVEEIGDEWILLRVTRADRPPTAKGMARQISRGFHFTRTKITSP